MQPLVATRDCDVCGESWDDACRSFGTAIMSPCPGHHLVRRPAPRRLQTPQKSPAPSAVHSPSDQVSTEDPLTSYEVMRRSRQHERIRSEPDITHHAQPEPTRPELIRQGTREGTRPELTRQGTREVTRPELTHPGTRDLTHSGTRELTHPGTRDLTHPGTRELTRPESRGSTHLLRSPFEPMREEASSVEMSPVSSGGGFRGKATPPLPSSLPNTAFATSATTEHVTSSSSSSSSSGGFPHETNHDPINTAPTQYPSDDSRTPPPETMVEVNQPPVKKKKRRIEEEWNCGGFTCSYLCIWESIRGMFTKDGWFRRWWDAVGNKKYLSREEFEMSLNSYAELLRLLDFYIVQRETGQLQAKDFAALKGKQKPRNMTLSSPEARERRDQYLEALIVGVASLLRSCGSPTWRLDYQLTRVAEGLGLKGMTFIVFPSFIVATLPSDRGLGSRTLCFDTRYGYELSKLTAADNLARSIAALATNTDTFENMVMPTLATDVQKLVVAIANSPETLDQVFGFGYDQKNGTNPFNNSAAPRMRMQAKLEDAGSYMTMLQQHLGSQEAAVRQLKARVIELAHHGTGFFSFDIPHISKELDPDWDPDGKLEQFYELRRTAFLEISLEYALTELDKIEKAPRTFSSFMHILFGGMTAGASVGLFFKGGWWDVLLCFCLGSLIATVANYSTSKSLIRLFECIAAFFVGFLAVIMATLFPANICYSACSIASVVNLLQGVSITMAVVELATKNMISGTSRMFYALLLSVIIGIGTAAGARFGLVIMDAAHVKPYADIPTYCHEAVVDWWAWILLLPLACIAYCGTFGAGLKEMPSMLLAMFIAYGVSYATTNLGDSVSNILASFSVGVFSNLIQKFFPAFTPFVPIVAGLLILVPGSMAVRGFEAMMSTTSSINGLTITFRVLFTSLTLGLGLFLSSLVVTPHELIGRWRGKKHSRTLKALTV